MFLSCDSNNPYRLQQSGKRQDLSDYAQSGALTAEGVNTALDLGSKGIGLFSGIADLAEKIKNMIQGKREELLARGVYVDAASLGQAYAHLL